MKTTLTPDARQAVAQLRAIDVAVYRLTQSLALQHTDESEVAMALHRFLLERQVFPKIAEAQSALAKHCNADELDDMTRAFLSQWFGMGY